MATNETPAKSSSPTWTPHIEREVVLRPGTSDSQVWADTFTGLYHVPPPEMPTPATVLDLGANIGLTAAHYRYLWPKAKVVAVEMDLANYELAQRNAPGVIHRRAAVAAISGPGWYDDATEAFAFRLEVDGVPVECLSLRELVVRDLMVADFVKMDVEGAEWEILETPTWAPLVRNLLVELHGTTAPGQMTRRAIALLELAGFEARPHPPHPQAVYAWR